MSTFLFAVCFTPLLSIVYCSTSFEVSTSIIYERPLWLKLPSLFNFLFLTIGYVMIIDKSLPNRLIAAFTCLHWTINTVANIMVLNKTSQERSLSSFHHHCPSSSWSTSTGRFRKSGGPCSCHVPSRSEVQGPVFLGLKLPTKSLM